MAVPGAKRLHSLELIGRLRERAVEEAAEVIGRLRAEIARIEAARAELVAARRAGPQSHSIEAVPYLSAFLLASREEEARLDSARAALEQQLRGAEAELRARFRDAKVNDTLLSRARDARRDAEAAAEAAEQDEIALRGYIPGVG